MAGSKMAWLSSKPGRWLIDWASVRGVLPGTRPSGRYRDMSSRTPTSPSSTSIMTATQVKSLVVEPISNRVSSGLTGGPLSTSAMKNAKRLALPNVLPVST